jgi:hypothetical protein
MPAHTRFFDGTLTFIEMNDIYILAEYFLCITQEGCLLFVGLKEQQSQ